MKFNKWSQLRINEGRKFLTSRKKAYYNDPLVKYIEGPLKWGFIRDFLYRDEGANSPEELQRVINKIFRRIVNDEELFFVHVLNISSGSSGNQGGRVC